MSIKTSPQPITDIEAIQNLVGFFDVLIEMDISSKESEGQTNDR